MKRRLEDLLDVPRLQSALDSLYVSSKIASAIIDNDGVIHTGSGWQDVCTKFHRVHPEARKRCLESDLYIAGHIHEADPSVIYKCPHGLVDSATPIVIEGEHIGNVFTGQMFLEEPDTDFFRAQARAYGFDEEEYLDAVKKVPIVTERALEENLAFVAHLTGMLAEMGLKRMSEKEAERRLREIEEKSRKELEESEARYRRITECLMDYRYTVRVENGRAVETTQSPTCERMTGYTAGELAADPYLWIRMVAPEDRALVRDVVRQVLAGKDVPPVEHRIVRKDGETRWVSDTTILFRDASGNLLSYDGVIKDITERRLAEEALRASLREKEILLREIHHRVKNNMTVVSSLLSLQADRIQAPALKAMFEESRQRIKSMALVHEKLYATADLSRIDLADYVRSLVDGLLASLHRPGREILARVDVGEVLLDLDAAVPCGLILNELVTNALKYAFEGREKGEVAVSFTKEGDACTLAVRDDGVGLPAGFDPRNTRTLGLRIVDALARQLRGEVRFGSGGGGTEAVVTFARQGGRRG